MSEVAQRDTGAEVVVRLHVERTDDPAVLRWVVHSEVVDAAGDGPCRIDPTSALGAVVAGGSIAEVWVEDGTVLVRRAEHDWGGLTAQVHAAIAADLATSAPWLGQRQGPARRTMVAVVAEPSGGCGGGHGCHGCSGVRGA